MEKQEEQTRHKGGFAREMTGLFLFFWAIFLVLCLVSFDKNDPTLNQVSSAALIHNKAGLFGAYVAGFLNEWFGLCAFLWPLFFVTLGCSCISKRFVLDWRRWLGIFLLVLFLLETSVAWGISAGDFSPGGISGHGLYGCTTRYLHPLGASLLWLFLFMIALQLILNISWFESIAKLNRIARETFQAKRERALETPSSALLVSASDEEGHAASFRPSGLLFRLRQFLSKGKNSPPPAAKADKKGKKNNHQAPDAQEETLFQPPENLFKDSPDEDDVLGLGAGKEAAHKQDQREAREAEEETKPADNQPVTAEESLPEGGEEEVLAAQSAEDTEAAPKRNASALDSLKALFTKKNEKKTEEKATPKPATHAKSSWNGLLPLPPVSLLTPPEPPSREKENAQEKAQVLMQTLSDFSIEGELAAITPGPVVTLFEVRPATGVRVSKFLSISDDMARVLKMPSVRVISPVPGKDTVGVEIPNRVREFVNFQELVGSDLFRKDQNPLTMILGKNTAGAPVFADLSKMPHMLIAGATGTGKSVCLNCILASFLYRCQPSDLKLLLIDPKRVEMSVYADEPHLIHPVVNEPSEAKNALEWATEEMDKRFKAMARLSVRNIAAFNKRLASFGKNRPDELSDLEHLPYVAIVIDELADLMMMADRKDIELSIVRLAQLARACGIHMILATQRPSVNVVTGLIKANFPCRVSFQVASSADSRTILDTVGAEKLLGRGDMLYRPGDTTLQRLHGAFLSDDDVCKLVEYWKAQAQPSYKVDFKQWSTEEEYVKGSQRNESDNDDLFEDVLAFVMDEGTASISKIQRRFKIGFNRSARLVEALEARGYLEPGDGTKPRKCIRPGYH